MLRRDDRVAELKRQLAAELARVTHGWTLVEIAARTGESIPRICAARKEKLDGISLEALIRMLSRLGKRIVVDVVAGAGVR